MLTTLEFTKQGVNKYEFLNLSNLNTAELSDINLSSLPNLSSLNNLNVLYVARNKLDFGDIEPNVRNGLNFYYFEQDSVGQLLQVNANNQSPVTLTVSVGGSSNLYQWTKNGMDIPGATNPIYTIISPTMQDQGSYRCRITNTIATQLTLYSRVNSITVAPPLLCGNVTVGIGGDYPNLTGVGGLFEKINTYGLTCNVTALIISDLNELGMNPLYQWNENGIGNYSLTIKSNSNVRRTITMIGSAPYSSLNFNGADRVTIDGEINKNLLFRNTVEQNTIGFASGSEDITIKNCILENNSQNILELGSQNKFIILNNEFRNQEGPNPGLPRHCISSYASQDQLIISNNYFYNFDQCGLSLYNLSSGCSIIGNSFFNNMSDPVLAKKGNQGIYISNGDNCQITGNFIGGRGPMCSGSSWETNYFVSIMIDGGSTAPNSIQGNTITNFLGGSLTGIQINSGTILIGSTTMNLIGSDSVANGITINAGGRFNGIYNSSTSGTTLIENNVFQNISITGTSNVGYNTIVNGILTCGGKIRKNKFIDIDALASATPIITGIYIRGQNGIPVEISNNQIKLSPQSASELYGLYIEPSGNLSSINIWYNTINISGPSNGSNYCLYSNSNATVDIKNNILSNTRNGYSIYFTKNQYSVLNSNYNDLFTTGNYLSYYANAYPNFTYSNYPSLISWQSGTGQDLSSVSADPLFISTSDLHPNACALNNSAIPIPEVTTDYANVIRGNPPDIGAYEFELTSPAPVPTITGMTTVCSPVYTGYTTEAGMTGYTWVVSEGGTISSGQGTNFIMVNWLATGAQTLSVNYINANGCSAQAATVINVNLIPKPVTTITGPNQVCTASAGNVYVTEGGMTNYNWVISAGGSISSGSGTNSIAVNWNTAGFQTIVLTYTDPSTGCVGYNMSGVTVNPTLPASISITASANPVFLGETVIYTATPTNAGTTPIYQWKVNDNNVGTNSLTYTYIPSDGDIVRCELTSSQPCVLTNPANSNQITMSVLNNTPCPGIPNVVYGGQTYNTVLIGSQCWMKENLNIGTTINAQDQTNNGIIEKYCYNNLQSNCDIYGGLYQWNEMMQYVTTEGTQGICPSGWHIPSESDWNTLITGLGGGSVAGGKMKKIGYSWAQPNAGATNSSGFTGLPGGGSEGGTFPINNIWYYGYHQSSTLDQDNQPRIVLLYYYDPAVSIWSNNTMDHKTQGFSVRCIKDNCTSYSTVNITISASANPICTGASVTFTATPTNGGTSPTYQWKVNGVNVGANNPIYSYVPSNGDIISCVLTSNLSCTIGNPATSNTLTITVNPIPVAPISINASPAVICGAGSSTLTAIGGGGIDYTLKWYEGSCGGNLIGTGTTISVTPTSTTTYFARWESPSCNSDCISRTVPVWPPFVAGTLSANQSICYNAIPAMLTATAPTGGNGFLTILWEYSTNGINFSPVSGASTLSYQPGPLTVTTWYRQVQLTGNTCGTPLTNTVMITVYPPFIAGSVSGSQNICSNSTPTLLIGNAPTGGKAPYSYQWQSSVDGVNFFPVPGATGLNYQPGPLTNTTWYRQEQTSGSGCGLAITTPVVITVQSQSMTPPTISGNTNVCAGSTGNLYSTEGGMINYSWNVSPGGLIVSGSGTNSIVVTWNTPGLQTVSVNYSNTVGCSSPTPTNLNVTVNSYSGSGEVTIGSGTSTTSYPFYSFYMDSRTQMLYTSSEILMSGGSPGQITKIGFDITSAAGQILNGFKIRMKNTTQSSISTWDNDMINVFEGTYSVPATGVQWITLQTPFTWNGSNILVEICLNNNSYTFSSNVKATSAPNKTIHYHYDGPTTDGCLTTGCGSYSFRPDIKFSMPQGKPNINGPGSLCLGTLVSTYTTETGMANYQWNVSPNGTISSGGSNVDDYATVNWNSSGTGTISVLFTNPLGCSPLLPGIKNVTINTLPQPNIQGNSFLCTGTSTVYSTESAMSDYQWNISPGGTILTGAESNAITVIWHTTGPQWVNVNYINGKGCQASSPTQFDVMVNPLPNSEISGPEILCAGPVSINYTAEPGFANYTWNISSGGTIISGGTNTDNFVTIAWNVAGPQHVSLFSTNTANCSSQGRMNVLVNAPPSAEAGGAQTICEGSSLQLTGQGEANPKLVLCVENCSIIPSCISNSKNFNYEYISSISLNGATNSSPGSNYTDNTANIFTTLFADSTYVLSGTIKNDSKDFVTAFIDWNRNGVFETGEEIVLLTNTAAGNTSESFSNSITVPTDALLGELRLRIVLTWDTIPMACGIYNYGETEDYKIEVMKYTPNSVNYSWVGPNGFTSNLQNPVITGATALSTGSYTLMVSDANNCSASDVVFHTVNPNSAPTLSSPVYAGGVHIKCKGGTNGEITTTLNSGTPPYTFNWSNGASTQNLSGLTAGNYSVIVTDLNNCSSSNSIALNEPPLLVADAGINKSVCPGTGTQIGGSPTGSGGVAPYSYQWSPLTGLNSATHANPIATPQTTTTYHVTVTDQNNCLALNSATVSVNQLPVINITAIPSNSVFTGGVPTTIYLGYGPQSVTLASTVSGGSGFTYLWTSSALGISKLNCTTCASPVFTPSEEGKYVFTLNVNNSSGCSSSLSITICVMDIRVPNQNCINPN